VLIAFSFPKSGFVTDGDVDFSEKIRASFAKLFKSMVEKGAVLVTGSGNSDKKGATYTNTVVDGYPQLLAVSEAPVDGYGAILPVDELVVVGAIDVKSGNTWGGTKMLTAQGLPHVYAPGDSVWVADGNKAHWKNSIYRPSSGTSDAAALTAGLAAYLIRLGLDDTIKKY
jgi:hypothetical protein